MYITSSQIVVNYFGLGCGTTISLQARDNLFKRVTTGTYPVQADKRPPPDVAPHLSSADLGLVANRS